MYFHPELLFKSQKKKFSSSIFSLSHFVLQIWKVLFFVCMLIMIWIVNEEDECGYLKLFPGGTYPFSITAAFNWFASH